MIQIEYINFIGCVTKESNYKYFIGYVTNNLNRVFITAQANSLNELITEFQISVNVYLEFQEEVSNEKLEALLSIS